MAADWEEVKRLAADFQRAQLGTSVQKLSERNCIEIVKKLIDLKLIDVIFTTDGKEYITPDHLLREIQDELYVHGGRINLVDLAQILNLDLSHIEAKASELVKNDADITIILGQLLDRSYLDRLGEEVNEKLQQCGQVTIGELTKLYNLPGDFLEDVVSKRLGTIIHGQADPFDSRVIFTEDFISQHKAVIRGVLSAVTRPIQVTSLMSRYGIPERLFYTVCDDLIKEGRLQGALSGGRSDRTTYVPNIYAKSQNEWVDSFYKQNGYLEFDSLSRLGISDSKAYVKRHFKDQPLTFLHSCCVGKQIMEQVDSTIEEALSSGSWTDILPVLPSVFGGKDIQQVMQLCMKEKGKQGAQIFCETVIVSDPLLQDCMKHFEPLMAIKAEEDYQKGLHLPVIGKTVVSPTGGAKPIPEETKGGKSDRKDDRRKKGTAGGKAGGGAGSQGREVKTKAVKKKYKAGKGDDSDSDDDSSLGSGGASSLVVGKPPTLSFLTEAEVQEQLNRLPALHDCPEELLSEIAQHIHRPLTRKYQEVARSIFLASASATGAARRKTHSELQEKINSQLADVHMYAKGLQLFKDDTQLKLVKHLLRTLCSEMSNQAINYIAIELGLANETDSQLQTPEARLKVINKFPANMREPLMKLHNTLNGKEVDEFICQMESVLGSSICDIVVKKMDKKRERVSILTSKQSLMEQLEKSADPALTLHLAVLLIFQAQTKSMLHASGKFVPQIIGYLQRHVPDEVYQLLQQSEELVIKQLTLEKDCSEKEEVKSKLDGILSKVKEAAMTYKKAAQTEDT